MSTQRMHYVDMSTHSSVLITGGSNGIGLALAQRYSERGDRVMVTGRSPAPLRTAAERLPGLETVVSDIAVPAARERLAAYVRAEMPEIDVLVNNAGIQRRVSLASDDAPWQQRQVEIDTLLAGPIHLSSLLAPVLVQRDQPSVIVNVTSGGALIPQPFAPIYSACKAAMHSFTINLRFALRDTQVRVVEVIPPAVATGLAGSGAAHGAPVEDFADAVFDALAKGGADEIGYGVTDSSAVVMRREIDRELFDAASMRFPVVGYSTGAGDGVNAR